MIGVKHISLNLVFPLIPELDHCQPVVAIVEGDKAVSVCQSVRKSEEAEEAGVDTLLPHRGKGYAAQVVAGWARIVRDRIPLYSTSWDNEPLNALQKSWDYSYMVWRSTYRSNPQER